MLRTSGWKWVLINPTEKISIEQIRQQALWRRKSRDEKGENKGREKEQQV